MDGGHDQVVAGQQLVGIVEGRVGPDLELAAVQQPKALRRSLGRGGAVGFLGLEPAIQRRDYGPLHLDSLEGEATRNRQAGCVVGQGKVRVAPPAGRFRHLLDRVNAVGPVGVAVAVAAQVRPRHQMGQRPGKARLHLAPVLAQLGLDERQPQEAVRRRLGRKRPQLGRLPRLPYRRLAVVPKLQVTLLGQAPTHVASHAPQADVVLLRAGEVDQVCAGLAGGHDHQVHARAQAWTVHPGARR